MFISLNKYKNVSDKKRNLTLDSRNLNSSKESITSSEVNMFCSFQKALQRRRYATVWRGLWLYRAYLLFHVALDDTLYSAYYFLDE